MAFHYNENGEVIGFNYKDSEYIFERDITRNINSILDITGKEMVKYTYTAYGEVTKAKASGLTTDEEELASELMEENIILYKGYVYDNVSHLFYCNSRYYSPELCRWISPDSIDYLEPGSINGLNLYCYCYNNPIMNIDPSGHIAISLTMIGPIVGAGVGALVSKATGILGLSIVKGNVFVVTKTMVLGHCGYAALGTSLGYGFYEISDDLYYSMTNAQRWP